MRTKVTSRAAIVLLVATSVSLTLGAQSTVPAPATDSSHQASPASSAGISGARSATDSSAQASPLLARNAHAREHAIPGDILTVVLQNTISSSAAHNGQLLHGHLLQPLPAQGDRQHFAAGAPVTLSVLATVPAGRITSYGEITLQATHVGTIPVFTLPLTFRGKRGAKDLPDSAPKKGGEAILSPATKLSFRVQPPPRPAGARPQGTRVGVPQPVPEAGSPQR